MKYNLLFPLNLVSATDVGAVVFMGRGDRGVIALGKNAKALARSLSGDPDQGSGSPRRRKPSEDQQTSLVIVGGLRSQERIVLEQCSTTGKWKLPSRPLADGEQLLEAAQKSLGDAGVESAKLSELGEYGQDGQPHSTVFLARMRLTVPLTGSDGQVIRWFKINDLPEIHPDSQKIVDDALVRLTQD